MLSETNFKKNFGNKLNTLRKQRGMTQSELGYQLNYSDKAISKWERGDSVPDSYTVYKIAHLFGVPVDEILSPEKELNLKEAKPKENLKPSKLFVPIITAVCVLFLASIVFLVMKNVEPWSAYAEYAFLYAIPVAAIVLTIFSSLWWRMVYRCIFVSLIIWTSAFAVYFSFELENLKYIFIPCAILQVACILAYVFAYFVVKKK